MISINGVWDKIRNHDYVGAENLYQNLQSEKKEDPDARYAYALILEAKKQFQDALSILQSLPAEKQLSFPITKRHIKLLIRLKEYSQAILIIKESEFKNHPHLRLNQIECHYSLKQHKEAKALVEKFSLKERKDPFIAAQLAHAYYYLGEDGTKVITSIPNYMENFQLIKSLMQLYGISQQYDLLKLFFDDLSQTMKNNSKILIIYASEMLQYQGDLQSKEQILTEINDILLKLLQQEHSNRVYKKVINIIFHNQLETTQYNFYIQRYIKENPSDHAIAALAGISLNETSNLEFLLKDPEKNLSQLLQYLYNIKNDCKTSITIFQKILEQDEGKRRFRLWNQYASFLTNNHFFEEAIPIYDELIKKYPSYAPFYLGLATSYDKTNKKEEKLKILRLGNQACPDNFSVLNLLARALFHQEEFHESLKLFSNFCVNYPAHIGARVQLAYTYCRIGQPFSGVRLLQEILKTSPHINNVIMAHGHCLIEAHLFDNANQHFEKYRTNKLYWSKLAELHARSLQKQGHLRKAFNILKTMHNRCNNLESYLLVINFFTDALKQKMKFEEAPSYIQNALNHYDDVKLYINISFYYLEMGDLESAKVYCQKAMEKDPNNINANVLKNKIEPNLQTNSDISSFEELIQQGWDMLKNGKIKKAKILLEKLQSFYPLSRKTFLFCAKYSIAVGSYRNAESSLLDIEKQYGGLTMDEIITLTIVYEHTARLSKSIEKLCDLIKTDPFDIEILLRLAYTYTQHNELDKAIETCFKVIKIFPNELRAILQLVRIALIQKSPVAFNYLAKAENIQPRSLQVALQKAYALKEFKRDREALAVLLKAFEDHSTDLTLLLQIFDLYFKNNDLTKAKEFIDKLMNLHKRDLNVQLAYIHFKKVTEKQNAYDEIETMFKDLQRKHPEKPKVLFEYALFVKQSQGIIEAISVLNKALTGSCKFYAKAYYELANYYVLNRKLLKARRIYLKGIKLFPTDCVFIKEYLYFQLNILKVKDKALTKTIQFYKNCCEKFQRNPMISAMHEILFRANLKEHIPLPQDEMVCKLSRLALNTPVLALIEKIHNTGFRAYSIGGAPRYYYMKEALKVNFEIKLNDIDIITDAPIELLQSSSLFPEAIQNNCNPKQLHFYYEGYSIDINCIDIQIESLYHYLISQKGLNIDCLIMDKDGILLDPTQMAFKGIQNGELDFIADEQDTCLENPILLFRLIRHLHEYHCKLAPHLLDNQVLYKMANALHYVQPGRIISEIIKILKRGHAQESFITMINHQVLEIINPILFSYLQNNAMFNEWFFIQLAQTDCMINSQINLSSKAYVAGVYLMPQIFEAFYASGKDYLCDDLIDELLLQTFGTRLERPQIRFTIYNFFASLRDVLRPYHPPFEMQDQGPVQEQDLDLAQDQNPVQEQAPIANILLSHDVPIFQPQENNPSPPLILGSQGISYYLYSFMPNMPDVWEIFNTAKSYLPWYGRLASNQTSPTPLQQDYPTEMKEKKLHK